LSQEVTIKDVLTRIEKLDSDLAKSFFKLQESINLLLQAKLREPEELRPSAQGPWTPTSNPTIEKIDFNTLSSHNASLYNTLKESGRAEDQNYRYWYNKDRPAFAFRKRRGR
jgi:hypothetical protein